MIVHSLSISKSYVSLQLAHIEALEAKTVCLKDALQVACNKIITLLLVEKQYTCSLLNDLDSSLYFKMHAIMEDKEVAYPKIALIKVLRDRLGCTLGDGDEIAKNFIDQYHK